MTPYQRSIRRVRIEQALIAVGCVVIWVGFLAEIWWLTR